MPFNSFARKLMISLSLPQSEKARLLPIPVCRLYKPGARAASDCRDGGRRRGGGIGRAAAAPEIENRPRGRGRGGGGPRASGEPAAAPAHLLLLLAGAATTTPAGGDKEDQRPWL